MRNAMLLSLAAALGGCSADLSPVDPVDETSAAATTSYTLYLAPEPLGNDANSGTSASAPLATLARAQEILYDVQPELAVFIKVMPGNYYCAGSQAEWTYYNPTKTTYIQPRYPAHVPSPGSSSADDPDRPVFHGVRADGTLCPTTTWLTVTHGDEPANLFIQGLKVTRYRNGLSIENRFDGLPTVLHHNTIDNMVFERIGDYYYPNHGSGKGAIKLTQSRGNTIQNSYFRWIKNVPETAGLIHGIYFTGRSSNNTISNNHFHSLSSSVIKLTNYSNGNRFLENRFSYLYAGYAMYDRWCGSVQPNDELEECGGEWECPSWDNYFPIEKNYFSNVSGKVRVLEIPPGQTCGYPARNLRMNLGTAGAVYGGDGTTF